MVSVDLQEVLQLINQNSKMTTIKSPVPHPSSPAVSPPPPKAAETPRTISSAQRQLMSSTMRTELRLTLGTPWLPRLTRGRDSEEAITGV